MNYTISSLDFAAIAGVSPYDSPISLFLKKKGKIPREIEENFRMKLGKRMEAIHRQLLCERGIIVTSSDYALRKHPQYNEFICIPDGFTIYNDMPRVVECKTIFGSRDKLLQFYEAQLLWEMMVCQYDGLLTILTPDDILIKEYSRDLNIEAEMQRLAFQFLELLKRDELPNEENYHPATLPALRALKRPIEEPIQFDDADVDIFKKIEELKKQIKQCEKAIEFLQSQLLIELGENKQGICGDYHLKVISYESKPAITISEVNDDLIKGLDEMGVKYHLREAQVINRIQITNKSKTKGD